MTKAVEGEGLRQRPSTTSQPSKPPVSITSPSFSLLPQIKIGPVELVLFKNESKGGLDKNSVTELTKEYFKGNHQKTIDDLNHRVSRLEENERHQLRQELDRRVSEMKEQLGSGASERQIIEAHAQGANANMKGVITGVACAVLVGLVVVTAISYMSKDASKTTAGQTDNGHDSDDDWDDAAKGSSVEQLEFAMAKLREMNV